MIKLKDILLEQNQEPKENAANMPRTMKPTMNTTNETYPKKQSEPYPK